MSCEPPSNDDGELEFELAREGAEDPHLDDAAVDGVLSPHRNLLSRTMSIPERGSMPLAVHAFCEERSFPQELEAIESQWRLSDELKLIVVFVTGRRRA